MFVTNAVQQYVHVERVLSQIGGELITMYANLYEALPLYVVVTNPVETQMLRNIQFSGQHLLCV